MFYIGSVSIIGTLILVNIGYRNIGKRAYRCNTTILHTLRLNSTKKKSRITKYSDSDKLYPISVLEHDSKGKVKIHYVGYGSEYDQWKDAAELFNVESPCVLSERYDFHQDLALRIKSLLTTSATKKSNPCVNISMPFDEKEFSEGLAILGYVHSAKKQITCYRIRRYSDLDELLGKGWHFRGLNSIGDYCFVVPDTVEYYLCHRRPIVHFVPNNDGSPVKVCTPQGFMLHFTFERSDGTSSDFGKNFS